MRKDAMLGHMMQMSDEGRAEVVNRIKTYAEEQSKFKKFQLVRACMSPGISLVGGIRHLPHDHADPAQHLDTRVIGWSCFGDIQIAYPYWDNPHCGEATWSDDMLASRDGEDWALKSKFKPDQRVTFQWELSGFGEEFGTTGRIAPAILIAPHIKEGDWYVTYEKASGDWINRVLNENKMCLA